MPAYATLAGIRRHFAGRLNSGVRLVTFTGCKVVLSQALTVRRDCWQFGQLMHQSHAHQHVVRVLPWPRLRSVRVGAAGIMLWGRASVFCVLAYVRSGVGAMAGSGFGWSASPGIRRPTVTTLRWPCGSRSGQPPRPNKSFKPKLLRGTSRVPTLR